MNSTRILFEAHRKGCRRIFALFNSTQKTKHPYLTKYNSSAELAKDLVKNVIYNKDGIVVLNKPNGISFSDGQPKSNDFEISLHTLLPYLKDKLNYRHLFPTKIPEKYASGVAIFCTSEDLQKKVGKCLHLMRLKGIPPEHYECVVLGQPNSERGQYDGGISLVTSPNGKHKGIQLVQKCSKSAVREGRVKNTHIAHELVCGNELASRLKMSITRTKWHGLRVYAATHLVSPILGDRVFGGFVKQVLGQTVLIDMWSPAASVPQKLPRSLLTKLDLASREDVEIPLHLHLVKVTLTDFPRKGNGLELFADPPLFFEWTCKQLHLHGESDTRPITQKTVASN